MLNVFVLDLHFSPEKVCFLIASGSFHVYGELIIVFPKPLAIYFRGTIPLLTTHEFVIKTGGHYKSMLPFGSHIVAINNLYTLNPKP